MSRPINSKIGWLLARLLVRFFPPNLYHQDHVLSTSVQAPYFELKWNRAPIDFNTHLWINADELTNEQKSFDSRERLERTTGEKFNRERQNTHRITFTAKQPRIIRGTVYSKQSKVWGKIAIELIAFNTLCWINVDVIYNVPSVLNSAAKSRKS